MIVCLARMAPAVVAIAVSVAADAGAHAVEAPPSPPGATAAARAVGISSSGCAPASPPFIAFVESLRAELAGHAARCCTVDAPDAPPPLGPSAIVTIEPCDPASPAIAVAVQDPARAVSLRRSLALDDVAEGARPRVLALAVAELVQSLPEGSAQQAPAPGVVARSEGAGAPLGDAPQVDARRGLAATAEISFYPRRHTTLWGGRIAFSPAGARWRAALDVHAAAGSRATEIGDIAVKTAGVGLEAGPRFDVARAAELDLGLFGEVGWAWIGGESMQPGVVTGDGSAPVAALGLRAAVELPLGSWLRVRAVTQGGFVLRGVSGEVNGSPVAGISGAYVLFGLGAALSGAPAPL